MSTNEIAARQQDLISYIKEGRIIDAMHEFYADDVVMIEGNGDRHEGLATNLDREQAFLDGVAEWRGFDAVAVGAGDGATFLEATLEFKSTGGDDVRLEQLSVQRWRDGKIYEERFYYNAG